MESLDFENKLVEFALADRESAPTGTILSPEVGATPIHSLLYAVTWMHSCAVSRFSPAGPIPYFGWDKLDTIVSPCLSRTTTEGNKWFRINTVIRHSNCEGRLQKSMGSFGQFAKSLTLLFVCANALLPATLERLSPEQLIEESTEIVRGKVLYCTSTYRPPVIWTLCEIAVTERFKGPAASRVTVAVPGGISSGIRQTYAGAPTLDREKEYMFFLWQGKSGLKQIMGLCQGLLTIVRDDKGNLVAYRGKTEERMLDASGQEVTDTGFTMRLNEMRAKIAGLRQQ